MKKITRIFALALAFVMAFALQAPVNAAEKAAVNQEKAQATVQAGSFTHRVQSLYYNSSTKKASLTIKSILTFLPDNFTVQTPVLIPYP